MSFAHPVWLVLLVLLPLLALLAVRADRRRRRYAVRFANFPALAAAVGRTPWWRKWTPTALLLSALAALVLALAHPQREVGVPVDEASIVLVTDISGSMRAQDVKPDRISAARNAAISFLGQVPARVRVGLVSFSDTASILQAPTTDRQQVKDALSTLQADGGTSTATAIETAIKALTPARGQRRPPSAIVLLSDGKATSGGDPVEAARNARRLRIPISTIALGTPGGVIEQPGPFGQTQTLPVPPDPEAMRAIARVSGGKFFEVGDSDRLQAIYATLGSQLGTRNEEREITVAFAGAALLLLVAGTGLGLRWKGRLP